MITLSSLRARFQNDGEKQVDQLAEAMSLGPKDPPATILIRRKAIRVFPNGKRVALYYADKVNKFISIPYSGDFSGSNEIPMAEEEEIPFSEVLEEGMKARAKSVKAKKKSTKKVAIVTQSGDISNLSKLKQIATEKNTGMIKFGDGSSVRVDSNTAKSIHRVHGLVNDENKLKFERMLNKSKEHFLRASAFANGYHAQVGDPKTAKPAKKTNK